MNPSYQLGENVIAQLTKYNMKDTVLSVKADSTNSNTGGDNGAIPSIEKILDRPLYWGICDLHTNEESYKKIKD